VSGRSGRTSRPATAVAKHVPEPLRPRVRRMTEDGAAWLDELKDAEPQLAGDAQQLRTEFEGLR
jgi:hypothetical protein